jgi:hypothetical protein
MRDLLGFLVLNVGGMVGDGLVGVHMLLEPHHLPHLNIKKQFTGQYLAVSRIRNDLFRIQMRSSRRG